MSPPRGILFRWRLSLALVFLVSARLTAAGDDSDGFVPLFNGRDLSGWVNVNCAPGTFSARDGMIVSTGIPTGILRTEKQYENFELEFEWKHLHAGGNAGLFVWSDPLTAPGTPFARAIEVQVLDGHESETFTSHGDVFSIHGATMVPDRAHPKGWERCLPSQKRCRPAGQWNHYRVTCRDGTIKLAVNGEVVSGGSKCSPRKGYLCLEAEGSEAHFRGLRIKEFPTTHPEPSEIAPLAAGFRPLYTGVDLNGWRTGDGQSEHWAPHDWVLSYDGKGAGEETRLWSQEEFGDFELVCDWRLTGPTEKRFYPAETPQGPAVTPQGDLTKNSEVKLELVEVDDAGESGIILRGSDERETKIWCRPIGSGDVPGCRADPATPADVRQAVTPQTRADRPAGEWNRTIVRVRGDRLTVDLNGSRVIEEARLPGIPDRGRLGLVSHRGSIEFASLLIRKISASEDDRTANTANSSGKPEFALRDGDTVCFLGDSITAGGTYGKIVEDYSLMRFPERRLRFINAGIGGDTAAGGAARLERDVLARGATVVIVAFGVNDIGWGLKADDEHRQAYLNGIRTIVETCQRHGARVFICSAAVTGGDPAITESDYLAKMCADGMALSQSLGGGAIDVQSEMREILRRIWRHNAALPADQVKDKVTMHAPDTVHLNDLGYVAMAYAILRGLGAPSEVSSLKLDYATGSVVQAEHCVANHIERLEDGLEFDRLDERLPMNLGLFGGLHYRFVPIPDDLNRYLLAVAGMPEGEYAIRIDGRELGRFNHSRLAEGVNLASATADPWAPGGPWDAQATALRFLTDAKFDLDRSQLIARTYVPRQPEGAHVRERLASATEELEAAQRAAARPYAYRFVIKRVE